MYHYNRPPWDACVLITSSHPGKQGSFGTGFIVGHLEQKSYIVTCAHVIRDVGEDSIEVEGRPAKIVCLGAADGLDLAVIVTDEWVGKSIVKLAVCGGVGIPFFTAGFRKYGKHRIIASLEGKVFEKVELPQSKSYPERIGAWLLGIDHGKRLLEGYSGSPIIDCETNFCLGVLFYKGEESGQTGLAISIEELEKFWLEMPISIDKNSELQSSYQERLYQQANQSLIKGDLIQAQDLYDRIGILDPFNSDINRKKRFIQEEIERSYVDRFGRVNENQLPTGEQVVTTVARSRLKPPEKKSPSLLVQTVWVYVVIIVVFYTIIALSIAMFYLTGISLISSPFYPLPPDVETLPSK